MGTAPERRFTIPILSMVGLIAGVLAITASPAGAATCLAKDGSVSNSNLQTVIDSASTADTIVITGTCVGNFSIPGGGSATSLTLVGKKSATLNGNNSGSVVYIGPSETVTLQDLLITNGRGTEVSPGVTYGGGIFNDHATLTIAGKAQVRGNSASGFGGGIHNELGTLMIGGSVQVVENTANSGAGISNGRFSSTLNLSGKAQVNDNTANFYGGGVSNFGTMTVSDKAQVVGNTAAGRDGGGIFQTEGTLAMSGKARVDGNTAGRDAGGIFIANTNTLTITDHAQVMGNMRGTTAEGSTTSAAPSTCPARPR